MNSLVENQIEKFISTPIKKREVLSSAFNMKCEKITLLDNKKYIFKYYVKKNEEFNSITSEANSLKYLSKIITDIFPKIYFNSEELLVTEYIKHNSVKNNNYQIDLAEQVIKLHNIKNDKYGFDFDSQIGGLKQPNKLESNWSNFFLNKRINMIFEKINREKIMPQSINHKIEMLMKDINNYLPNNPTSRLIHGDLWEGNILFNNGSFAGLIDPGIYFAHNELEIAYLTWFKFIDEKFLNHYSNYIKIDKYFQKYEPIYQLYFSLLNIYLWDREYYLKDTNILLNKIFRQSSKKNLD